MDRSFFFSIIFVIPLRLKSTREFIFGQLCILKRCYTTTVSVLNDVVRFTLNFSRNVFFVCVVYEDENMSRRSICVFLIFFFIWSENIIFNNIVVRVL